ncbi:MAG: hypothetical protein FD152_2704 [Xanthobacteraceae bacterium]|nr:MAG: hypothetical protein FD152_2704 [Xanthobacteraceae bacterium]
MSRPSLKVAAVAVALLGSTAGLLAQDFDAWSCQDLWMERNQIYKNAGYCFSTARAIRVFGNAGCVYDRQEDVPLSATQRRIVQAIIRAERFNGCRY